MDDHQQLHTKSNHTLLDVLSESTRFTGKKVGFCFLTWNTEVASQYAAAAIRREQMALQLFGIQSEIFWVDNNSCDNTYQLVTDEFRPSRPGVFHRYDSNKGQCVARNEMIEDALRVGCDYLMMIDGDIEVVYHSTMALLAVLERLPQAGCVGCNSENSTHQWDPRVARIVAKVAPEMFRDLPFIAWTNYGLFKAEVFKDGTRFDENPPFQGPGWGLEDDDLAMQMILSGYKCYNTRWWRFMHRRRNSSLDSIPRTLAAKVFNERKRYLMEKWRHVHDPRIVQHLSRISGMGLPTVRS